MNEEIKKSTKKRGSYRPKCNKKLVVNTLLDMLQDYKNKEDKDSKDAAVNLNVLKTIIELEGYNTPVDGAQLIDYSKLKINFGKM